MPRRFITALIVGVIILLLAYTVLLNPKASASPKELNVISRTRGDEVLSAEISNNQLRIKLKNNHKDTITAFAIKFTDTVIKADFAYSDVHFGIEPGDTFQKDYAVSPSSLNSEPPPLYLLAVLLKDGAKDGDSKVAQEIRDERLGEKIQIHRTLKIWENQGPSYKDLKTTRSDIAAALNTNESEALLTLRELEPLTRSDSKLSDDLKKGLQVGREKMLRRFEILEQIPTEYREQGFIEYKDRLHKSFAKL
jgi:hypothetical protein